MAIGIKAPNFAKRKTSKILSEKVSEEIGGDCCIKITEAEFGMKNKKVYARFSVEGDMDRADFMNLIKMAMQSS